MAYYSSTLLAFSYCDCQATSISVVSRLPRVIKSHRRRYFVLIFIDDSNTTDEHLLHKASLKQDVLESPDEHQKLKDFGLIKVSVQQPEVNSMSLIGIGQIL